MLLEILRSQDWFHSVLTVTAQGYIHVHVGLVLLL